MQSFIYFGAAANNNTTAVIQKEDESKYLMHGYSCSATFTNGVNGK